MSEIFISYASPDRPIARQFAEALESAGWSVWWDREIPVGETFDQVIEEELNAARCVVVLWSKQSVLSRWVKAESAAAADRERLVPAMIDEVAIPLEFKRIQTATLIDWDGDTANPEFQRLVEAVRHMVDQPEPSGRNGVRETSSAGKPKTGKPIPRRLLGASAVALLMIVGLVLVKYIPQGRREETTPPVSNVPAESIQPPSPAKVTGPLSPSQSPRASDAPKPAAPKGAISIKIGERIGDGIPAPGAGVIESSGAEDIYTFTATPRQRVYFRMLEISNGMAQIRWRLLDDNGMEVFNTCLACVPGVQILSKGGDYTLTVGNKTDPATGTYRLQLLNVPAASQFSTKIGDKISSGVPASGAGVIESPGAEDIYTFAATPQQNVYFRMLEISNGMAQIRWRLLDDSGMEVFDTCLGCEPGVQTLSKGGDYTLTVGSKTDPATGTYRLQLFHVPAAGQFSIHIGDKVSPGVPASGAGVIESPGAEDIYTLTATPQQRVYFRMLEISNGMAQIKWRLLDDNGMEVFNTCLGCEPGVQTLSKGGEYTLILGSRTNPATGNYAFETGLR